MEIQVMTKSPKKNRDTQESIFSEQLEKSLPLKDVLALGHHLATELGFAGSCDTAGKWMSHHLAELIDKAEHEKDPEAKSEYQNKAAELILKIWKQRTSLKGDSYPLSKYKGILNALSILASETNCWNNHRSGKFESLAADSFSMIKDLYRGLIFSEYSGLKAHKDKQVPPSVLSEDELEIYSFLESWAEEEYDFRTIKENSDNRLRSKDDYYTKFNGKRWCHVGF